MNKFTGFLLIVIMALCFTLGTTITSKAQTKNYVGILPFMTPNGRMGFLDQNSGRIYVYDDSISQCLFIGQIQGLGLPIQVIK